jgi:hypothetical protein
MVLEHALSTAAWRKSTYSSGQSDNCVEVADRYNTPGVVPVRDSKAPHGPVIVFRAAAWSAFVSEVKTNRHG